MDRFLIITNEYKDPGSALSRKVETKILEAGKQVDRCHFDDAWTLRRDDGSAMRIDPDCECALIVGGDGTMLHAEHELFGYDIPMVGINMGTVGYLADINAADWESAIDDLMHGTPELDERMMLSGCLVRDDKVVFRDVAINDIVLGRNSMHGIGIDVRVNGQHLKSYYADGMIVSTPTGSTAYNLSAGGPIALPSSSLMLITPISPNVLINRSLVCSDDTVVELALTNRRNAPQASDAAIYFDGREYKVETNDRIEIVCAPRKAKLFKMSRINFLENLSRKMAEGEARI